MKERKLCYDRKKYILYSNTVKRVMLKHLTAAYNSASVGGIGEQVQEMDKELEMLKSDFPTDYLSMIEHMPEYMTSSGKTYKNHLATMELGKKADMKEEQKTGSGMSTLQAGTATRCACFNYVSASMSFGAGTTGSHWSVGQANNYRTFRRRH